MKKHFTHLRYAKRTEQLVLKTKFPKSGIDFQRLDRHTGGK